MDFRPLKAVFEKLFMPPILEKRLNHDAIRTKVQIFKNHLARDILFLRRRTLYPTELQRHLFNFWLISWVFGTSACIKKAPKSGSSNQKEVDFRPVY